MSEIGGEALLVLLLIGFNGLLAMSEIALISARKVRLRQRAEAGDVGAAAALKLAEQPTRFLSTVQVGITLVGIFAGAFGGATIAAKIGQMLAPLPVVGPYANAVALGVVVAAITYLSLIFGELVPKRIGLASAEAVAGKVAIPMRMLAQVASPLVSLLSFSTDVIVRLLRVRPSSDAPVTEEEVRMMIAEGAESGVFLEAEREIVESVFRFGDRRVEQLMVPRPRIVWLDVEDEPTEYWRIISDGRHDHYPVARGDLDQLLGIVPVRVLLATLLEGRPLDLLASLVQPTFVPESMTALQLLELFREMSPRVAVVVDEHGTIVGLVTPTDILEALVGDLPERGDEAGAEAVRREDGTWLVDGLFPVDELDDLLGVGRPTEDERHHFHTVGGLVMHGLGRIPTPGDAVTWGTLRVEVLDMDGRRVDKVLVSPGATQDAARGAAGSDGPGSRLPENST